MRLHPAGVVYVPEPEVRTVVVGSDADTAGAAQVASARRKFVVPPPLAGASPFSVLVTTSSNAVACVPVKSIGAAALPVLFPLRVLAAIGARRALANVPAQLSVSTCEAIAPFMLVSLTTD